MAQDGLGFEELVVCCLRSDFPVPEEPCIVERLQSNVVRDLALRV
jgi:hypothetical protein